MRSLTGYRISPRRLREAAQILGIERPVRARQVAGLACGYAGILRSTLFDGEHHLLVSRRFSRAEIDDTLWHELAHAMQFEQTAGDALDRPHVARARWRKRRRRELHAAGFNLSARWNPADSDAAQRYMSMPTEAEAYKIAARYAAAHPILIRERSRR